MAVCSTHPWVLVTVTKGHKLQFVIKPPPFNGIISSVETGDSARVLEVQIASLLEIKDYKMSFGIEEIQKGFYSCYFLIPKKDGGLRPILDLRAINMHLRKYKCRMLTIGALTLRGDWISKVDIKDACFHISIYPVHLKYLRFSFQNEVFKFVTLPFRLSLAPHVFSRCHH